MGLPRHSIFFVFFLFRFVTPRFPIRCSIPSLVPHSRNFTPTHLETYTLRHFLRTSPCVGVLPHSPVSFYPCSSTIVSGLNRCVTAVLCCLPNASHRETTPCVSVSFLTTPPMLPPCRASHHSHSEWRALLGLSVLTSARQSLSKLAHGLTHSLTHWLTHFLLELCVSSW